MNPIKNRAAAVGTVAAVALAAGVSAYAVTKTHASGTPAEKGTGAPAVDTRGDRRGFRGPGGGGLSTAASYLGLSASDLFAQLRNGETLAQIANATSGKSASGLVDAIVAAEKTEIEQSVASGRFTRAQADEIEADLRSRVSGMVNGAGFGRGRGFGGPRGDGGLPAATPSTHI